jgi:hypothetical protein
MMRAKAEHGTSRTTILARLDRDGRLRSAAKTPSSHNLSENAPIPTPAAPEPQVLETMPSDWDTTISTVPLLATVGLVTQF